MTWDKPSGPCQFPEATTAANRVDQIAASAMLQGEVRRVGVHAQRDCGSGRRPGNQRAQRFRNVATKTVAIAFAFASDCGNLQRSIAKARIVPHFGREELVFDVAVEKLQALDESGIFGSGADRDRLVLGIWMGDQSDEDRIEYVRLLNSGPVHERFERELQAGNDAFTALLRVRNRE